MQLLLVHNKKLLVLAVSYTILVSILCLRTIEIAFVAVDGFDKVGHASFHFGIVIIWFLYLKFRKPQVNTTLVLLQSVVFSFLFGLGLEYCQENFTLTRTSELADVYANVIGALIGISVIWLYKIFVFRKL